MIEKKTKENKEVYFLKQTTLNYIIKREKKRHQPMLTF